jgi:hypothetical protein
MATPIDSEFLYISDEHKVNPDRDYSAKVIDCPRKPKQVWTTIFRDRDKPPSLPFTPEHGKNAFHEDVSHDWSWRGGKLRYYSRMAESKVWIFLVF